MKLGYISNNRPGFSLQRGAGKGGTEGVGVGELVENVKRPGQQRRRDAKGTRHERRGRKANPLNLGLLDALGLGAPILEPDLDLGLGELELVGELGSLGDGEVLLLPELLL